MRTPDETPPAPRYSPPRAHSPHGLTVPRPVRPRGATCVGKATWVVPEESCRRVFRRYAVASAQPSARWELSALLVAGVLGPSPVRERFAGRASLSAVAGAHHGRHWPRGAGGRGNPGHLWH